MGVAAIAITGHAPDLKNNRGHSQGSELQGSDPTESTGYGLNQRSSYDFPEVLF